LGPKKKSEKSSAAAIPSDQELVFRKRELWWKNYVYWNNVVALVSSIVLTVAMVTWVEFIKPMVLMQTMSISFMMMFSSYYYC